MARETRPQIPYKGHVLDRVAVSLSVPDPRWEGESDGVRLLATQFADESWNVVASADGGKVSAVATGADIDTAADAAVESARVRAQQVLASLTALSSRSRSQALR